LFLLVSFNSFAGANSLSLNNDNLDCGDNNCNILLQKNYKLMLTEDERVIKLVEEIDGNEKLKNYIFYTTDINDLPAYSGKPLDMLIFLNINGNIDDLKLIKHSEPILLTGIPIEKLLEAVSFYKNKNINKKLHVGEDKGGLVGVPIILGATVTSLILHQTVLDSSRDVGKVFGFLDESGICDGGLNDIFIKMSFDDLLNNGAIQHYTLTSDKVENDKNDQDDLLVDIYFADLLHPSIGKNLLGEQEYDNLITELNPEESGDILEKKNSDKSAIMILNNGQWSFKGNGFVRGGIFDRFRIEQNNNIITFRDVNVLSIYDLEIMDIGDIREYGFFIINNTKYKPWIPWKLILLLDNTNYASDYSMPEKFCIKIDPDWLKLFKSQLFNLTLFLILWLCVIFIFLMRNSLVKSKFWLSAIYNVILILDIYIIGILIEGGQPSIVNLFPIIHDFNIKIFLLAPVIFLGWILMLITTVIWGKALFCGWICPFGALQELIFKFRSLVFKNDNSFEFASFDKLKYLRYIIFIFLIIVSFINISMAELFAEIEPFKTVWIVGIFARENFLFIGYSVLLLILSVFTYRIFCRFICPLGAFLSLLSFAVLLKLRRRGTCNICKICKYTCGSNAIDNDGKIDSMECFGCFSCIRQMYDKKICPAYIDVVRKKYEKGIFW